MKTNKPELLRRAVLSLKDEIAKDKYLEGVPSIKKTLVAFHAKDDCPEARERFYKMMVNLDFSAEFIVARKIESRFLKEHKGKPNLFYDDLIIKLFKNKLHSAQENFIYFAVRGDKIRQEPFEDAVQTAILTFENKWNKKVDAATKVFPQSPSGEPCLQIVDYMNWAIQRAFLRGEDRYFKFVEDKVNYLADIYDLDHYPNNFYSRKNKFDVNKISPL